MVEKKGGQLMERSHGEERIADGRVSIATIDYDEDPGMVGPLLSGLLTLLNSLLAKPDVQTLIDEILAAMRLVMDADSAYFFYMEDQHTLYNSYHQGTPLDEEWKYLRIGSNDSFAGEVAYRRELIFTPNITMEPYYNKVLHDRNHAMALLGSPVIVDDDLYGIIEVVWREPRTCLPIEKEILSLSAERIAQSYEAAESLKSARREARLTAALGELTQSVNDPSAASDTSVDAAYSQLKIIGDVLQVKTVMLYTGRDFNDEYGAPIHVYCEGRECDFTAPFEVFQRFVDGGDGILSESLQNDPFVMEWAQKNFGVTHGRIVSDQPVNNTIGCMIFGRTPSQPSLTLSELKFLQEALGIVSVAQKSNALRLDEGKISKTLQQALVSRIDDCDGFSFDTVYQSATSNSLVGGDFFGAIELPDGKVGILLGDISGKGVDSASLTYLVKNILASHLIREGSATIAEALGKLNSVMVSSPLVHNFASMYLICVDRETGETEYCCAGHPPACLRHEDGSYELLEERSPIVGALEGLEFEKAGIKLRHGDVLFLYTDGATEARSLSHEFFGEERVIEAFKREIGDGFEGVTGRVYDRIVEYAGGRIGDDLAMLAVRFD